MIPRAHITAWRSQAPWPDDAQVEQDLVLCRALVEMFQVKAIRDGLAFRGGTALHKLFFEKEHRYSEDIDLVQREAGAIGQLVDSIRGALDGWLGEPRWSRGQGRFTMMYRFDTTALPSRSMRLKVEINTREHLAVLGFASRNLRVENPWFTGEADITVFELEELLATKLRALYQRKKGRDLYDLWVALEECGDGVDDGQVMDCFRRYMEHGGTPVSRAQFERNIAGKLKDPAFMEDIEPLLPAGTGYDVEAAARVVLGRLVALVPGDPWKGS